MTSQEQTRNEFVSEYLSVHPESASFVLGKMNAKTVADVIGRFSPEVLAAALNLLPPSELADALDLLDETTLVSLVKRLSPNVVASVMRDWISEGKNSQQAGKAEMVLAIPDAKFLKAVKNLLLYPDGTVGSLMNPVPFAVTDGITVSELLDLLKKERHRYSRYVYIIEDNGKLVGVLPFKDAFYADEKATLAHLMTSKVVSIRPELSAQKAFSNPGWRKWDSIPVVDVEGTLLGVIREDVLEEYLENEPEREEDNTEILKAASAVGEVLQIALTGTASAFGFDPKKK